MDALDPANALHVVIAGAGLADLYQELDGKALNTLWLPEQSGVESLASRLDQRFTGLRFDSIAIYSHASPGLMDFGPDHTQAEQPAERQAWASIGRHLGEEGDLLIYGCNLAATEAGKELVDRLSALTQADVAASTDLTGSQGNWQLEYQTGRIESSHHDLLTGLTWAGDLGALEAPVRVPLHWVRINEAGTKQLKLGLYATVGAGSSPQLFELDTGAAGFYPVYADSQLAPWWGSDWTATGETVDQSYDSGNSYQANVVHTDLQLFANSDASEPLLLADDVVVGQTISVKNPELKPSDLWPPLSKGSKPPIDGAFFGDFGMAPKKGQKGIDSLAAQLDYGAGVTPGFRVHASSRHPWVQFGLQDSDLRTRSKTLTLNPEGSQSRKGIDYYQNLVVTGLLSFDQAPSGSLTGLLFDTGAPTTLHLAPGQKLARSVLSPDGARISSGTAINVSALSQQSSKNGRPVKLMTFKAGRTINENLMTVQKNSTYYLNTGILPFLSNDLIYNLGEAKLTLIPR